MFYSLSGWGDLPNVQPNTESSSWGESANSNPSVDNGTSAWGQPSRGCGGWGEGGHDSSGPYGRGNAPVGSGSCQEGNEMKETFSYLSTRYDRSLETKTLLIRRCAEFKYVI